MPVVYNYPSAVPQEFDFKQSARMATTAALAANTRSGNRLTMTANGVLAAIDGVTPVVGDRVLVKDEATGANNGLYTVTSIGSGSTAAILDRAEDADSSADVTTAMIIPISEGTTNGDTQWWLTTNDPITLNTTSLTFAQFAAPPAASGWTDDGAIVRLTTAADTVAIGTAAMSGAEKVRIVGNSRVEGNEAIVQAVATSGSPNAIAVTGGAHTTLAASTEATDVLLNLARTVQFATGALATQRAAFVQAPTYGFVGASTLTTAATFAISGAPEAGTNATITNPYALWVQGGRAVFGGAIGYADGVETAPGIAFETDRDTGFYRVAENYLGLSIGGVFRATWSVTSVEVNLPFRTAVGSAAAPSHSFFTDTDTGMYRTGPDALGFATGGIERLFVEDVGATLSQAVATSGSPRLLLLNGGAHTTLAATTEAVDINVNLARTVQFATGAITTQRAALVQAPTYAFVGASTITTAATFAISGAPVAGTNATITNPYAFWVQGGRTQLAGNVSVGAAGSSIGFFATAVAAQQAGVENLTNNVAAGGVDGTIANYTDLATYSTDAAAIRNDIYQLARSLLQVKNALRLYGLLS